MEGLDDFPCSSNKDCQDNSTIKQRAKKGELNINDARCCKPYARFIGVASCGGGPKWNECDLGFEQM